MTCKEFWNGDEHPRDHLAECPSCAARWSRQEVVAAGLKTLGRQLRRVEAPGRVEKRLVSAFRARSLTHVEPRGSWWLAGAWAAALAATALFGVALVRPHAPERTHRTVRNRTQLAAFEQSYDGMINTETPDSGYLPLPNAEVVGPNEEVDVVRVEVPRSAMIPLGFSVPAERAGEMVAADIMLDSDGVARAVRFLDSEKLAREISW